MKQINDAVISLALKFVSAPILLFFMLESCSQAPGNKKKEPKIAGKQETVHETQKAPANSDTIPLKLIVAGMFHADEVWDDVSNMKWVGLFKGKNGYYLKHTKLHAAHVNDPVLDEEDQKTGWEISVPENDTSVILLSPSSRFSNREIQKATVSKQHIYPGETVSFRYLGIDYKLFATGNKEKESEDSDWYVVSNYKLYVTATINGVSCKTLLSDQKYFDDNMVALIFTGDLDNDGIADFILDNSYHYNVTEPTLFLSGKASKGQVVKFAASHTNVGC